MALGLSLVWIDDGQDLDELTQKIEEERFALRLNRLEKLVMKARLKAQNSAPFTNLLYWQWRTGSYPTAGHMMIFRNGDRLAFENFDLAET